MCERDRSRRRVKGGRGRERGGSEGEKWRVGGTGREEEGERDEGGGVEEGRGGCVREEEVEKRRT